MQEYIFFLSAQRSASRRWLHFLCRGSYDYDVSAFSQPARQQNSSQNLFFIFPSFKRSMLLTCQSVLTVCDRPPATKHIHYSCTPTSAPITLAAASKAALFVRSARGCEESREAQRGQRLFRTITASSFTLIRCGVCPSRFSSSGPRCQSWKPFSPSMFAKAPLK